MVGDCFLLLLCLVLWLYLFQMLLDFTISNFRSFNEPQTLSMVASSRYPEHSEHLTSIRGGVSVLPLVAMYGATGAGKSSFVKALAFLKHLVITGTELKRPTGRVAYALDPAAAERSTDLVLRFLIEQETFVFGCRVGDFRIEEEWLHRIERGKIVPIYKRTTTAAGEVSVLPGPTLLRTGRKEAKKVLALAEIGVLENQLFLHVVRATLTRHDQGTVFAGVIDWIERLGILEADSDLLSLAQWLAAGLAVQDFAGGFLKKVATGVEGMNLASAQVGQEILGSINAAVRMRLDSMQVGEIAKVANPDGSVLLVEKGPGPEVYLRTVVTTHSDSRGEPVVFPFSEESAGTQRVTQLLQALHASGTRRSVVVIDGLERSLHPLLARAFVSAFLKAGAGEGGQLIFTTNDTVFLDLDLLRRDEVWFADKQKTQGATELYSMAKFRVRTDLRFDKAYLEGRFEAVPLIDEGLPEWVENTLAKLRPRSE